jgi:hypothetical protein
MEISHANDSMAALDIHEGYLLFSLFDMTENGEYTLTDLNITVNNFSELADMVRNLYSGRLVDFLDVRLAV